MNVYKTHWQGFTENMNVPIWGSACNGSSGLQRPHLTFCLLPTKLDHPNTHPIYLKFPSCHAPEFLTDSHTSHLISSFVVQALLLQKPTSNE